MQIKKVKHLMCFFILASECLLFSSFAEFLNINIDGRTSALADVTSVYTYPFSSIYGNPANCIGIKGVEFGYTQWLSDIVGNTVIAGYSFGSKDKPRLGVGVGYTILGTEFTDIVTQKSIKYADSLSSIVVGYSVFKNLRLGISIKYYLQQMDTISNTAIVIDTGGSFVTKKVVLGMSLRNFGSSLSETKQNLPSRIDVGMKCVILEKEEQQKINLLLETSSILNDKTVYKVSAEYTYLDVLTARVGYKFNTDLDKFSLGIGAKVKVPKVKLKTNIDLSYIPFGSLGSVLKVSFGIKL